MKATGSFVTVNGENLKAAMKEAKLEIKELARLCNVEDQTVRNYRSSTPLKPRRAVFDNLVRMADVLECDFTMLVFGGTPAEYPQEYHDFAIKSGIADATALKYSNLAGPWRVKVALDPKFDAIAPWNIDCVVEFRQRTDAHGAAASVGFSVDIGDEENLCRWIFDGCLIEAGNALEGCYQFIENCNPKHGQVMAQCYGDRIKGNFVGFNRKENYVKHFDGIVHGTIEADRVLASTPKAASKVDARIGASTQPARICLDPNSR